MHSPTDDVKYVKVGSFVSYVRTAHLSSTRGVCFFCVTYDVVQYCAFHEILDDLTLHSHCVNQPIDTELHRGHTVQATGEAVCGYVAL